MEAVEFCLLLVYFVALRSVFVLGFSGGPDEIRRLTAPARKRCLAEIKVPLQVVEDTEYGEFPEDEKLKCYFKCALDKTGMMDKKGNIKYSLLKKFVPDAFKELGNEMIDSCTGIAGDDNCDKAFKFMKCMFNINPIAYIAP